MIGGLLKSASSTALFAALGLVALGAGAPAAKAADLGGDCCADLEERVAELEATTARKGNRRVSLTISGQVTTALMAWDDGDRSDVYVIDYPGVGGTLFNLNGSARVSPTLSAGFHIQVGMSAGSRSHQVTATDDDGGNGGDTTIAITLANWYLDHKSLGRLTVGRANTATAGITGIDLGGIAPSANVNIGYWNRSFTATGDTGNTWGSLMGGNTVNGSTLSRGNVVNYTSPTAGGFSVAAAWGENDVWDVALRYAGEFSGFRVAAGIGYINNGSGLDEVVDFVPPHGDAPSQVKGSASILHVASGLFVNGAFVDQDNNNGSPNTTLWMVQGGIAKNWTGLGNTSLYGEYANVDNSLGGDGEAQVWGLGVVQHIDAAAMELYLSYRNYSGSDATPDKKGAVVNDMDIVMGGARIRF